MTDRMHHLVDALSRMTNSRYSIEEEADGALTAAIEIDGIDFMFIHEQDQPDHFMIYGRLGAVADDCADDFLRTLLQTNLAAARTGQAGYGMVMESAEVLHAIRASYEHAEPNAVLRSLANVAAQANEWRRQLLLVVPSDASTVLA
ncbi:CesT family type III secretion system chaperone [Variovorax paradoxus]|nr:CesT family type III secretion system chaperone [Variovorax paradoxus]